MSGGSDNEVKETSYQKELAKIAKEELGIYKEDIIPFRNSWVADVTGDVTSDQNKVAGQVNAQLAQMNTAIPAGLDPSTGAVTSNRSALGLSEAGSKATVSAKNAVKNNQVQNLESALGVMRGESTDAQTTLSGVAANSVNDAINEAYSDQQVSNTYGSSLVSAVGAGIALKQNRKTPKPDNRTDYGDTALQKSFSDWA